MNWNISYTKYMRTLEGCMNKYDENYTRLRATMRQILQEESSLSEIVQLVGKDSLSDDQKLTLEISKIIREDFLQQNAFTRYVVHNAKLKKHCVYRCRFSISRTPLSFKPVSVALSCSSDFLKHPNKSFFNVIIYLDFFYHTIIYTL